MNTPRFNVFNQIHKGLRALMFDTALQLQHTDLSNAAESATVLEQAELLLQLFDEHAWHEDTCILEAVAQHNPALIEEFESEHVTDMELTEQLRRQIADYKAAANPAAGYIKGNELFYALNEFIAFNLTHMNKEEQLLNQVLWQHYTDEGILDMERRIQQNIQPEKLAVYFKWMIKGMNNTELVHWLSAVKAGAPDFVFNGLLQACEAHLPAPRWVVVEQRVAEPVTA